MQHLEADRTRCVFMMFVMMWTRAFKLNSSKSSDRYVYLHIYLYENSKTVHPCKTEIGELRALTILCVCVCVCRRNICLNGTEYLPCEMEAVNVGICCGWSVGGWVLYLLYICVYICTKESLTLGPWVIYESAPKYCLHKFAAVSAFSIHHYFKSVNGIWIASRNEGARFAFKEKRGVVKREYRIVDHETFTFINYICNHSPAGTLRESVFEFARIILTLDSCCIFCSFLWREKYLLLYNWIPLQL